MDMIEVRVSELENRWIGIIQSKLIEGLKTEKQ